MATTVQKCIVAFTQAINGDMGPQVVAEAVARAAPPQLPPRIAVPADVLANEAAAATVLANGDVVRGVLAPVHQQLQVRGRGSCDATSHLPKRVHASSRPLRRPSLPASQLQRTSTGRTRYLLSGNSSQKQTPTRRSTSASPPASPSACSRRCACWADCTTSARCSPRRLQSSTSLNSGTQTSPRNCSTSLQRCHSRRSRLPASSPNARRSSTSCADVRGSDAREEACFGARGRWRWMMGVKWWRADSLGPAVRTPTSCDSPPYSPPPVDRGSRRCGPRAHPTRAP